MLVLDRSPIHTRPANVAPVVDEVSRQVIRLECLREILNFLQLLRLRQQLILLNF